VSNPYARKAPANPYAKKAPSANPYAKSASSSSTSAEAPTSSTGESGGSSLWVDKHKPVHTREILGNKANIKKLQDWLRTWERTFNNAKASNKTFSNPRGPWKAALLSGPPGIGSKSQSIVHVIVT
jgi:replication factor C subunit 1